MKASRYSTSRQKACQQCSGSKARCDRRPDGCTRCTQRGLSCTYTQSTPSRHPERRDTGAIDGSYLDGIFLPSRGQSASAGLPTPDRDHPPGSEDLTAILPDATATYDSFASSPTVSRSVDIPSVSPRTHRPTRGLESRENLDFSDLGLVCPINEGDIENRWLNAYVPLPGQVVKDYHPGTSAFIHQMLKSYAQSAARGRVIPPFIHPLQVSGTTDLPLATCLSVVRMCSQPIPGSESAATEILQREMAKVYSQRETYDSIALLAAYQAYLIYTMVIFFQLGQASRAFLREAMMNLQQLACSTCREGLVCLAEQQHARPRWEAWIVAEAKRRTLFTMYLFDSVLSQNEGLPTFLATELRGVPAPGSKTMWQAQARRDWEAGYNFHLADWPDGKLRIEELWPIPADFSEHDVTERRSRVDKWLEDLDEYGTMMYAVTCCTHGR